MTLLKRYDERGLEPFDILFKNFFDTNTFFSPLVDSKPKYPIDIYENEDGLQFDIAVVGLSEDDINIEVVDGDTLYISYNKGEDENLNSKTYIHNGIAKRSFNFGWKISNKFDLNNIDANIDNGLLSITIQHAEEAKPKKIEIKPKKIIRSKNK